MKRWLICIVVSGVMAFGASAAAAADAPTPHAISLVQRYFKALKMDQTIRPVMETMMGAMVENELNANPALTPLQRAAMLEAAKDMMADGMVGDMLNNMAPGFAQVLTEPELEALVGFYESPEGRSVIGKMDQLQKVGLQVGAQMAPGIGAEIRERACKKIECPK